MKIMIKHTANEAFYNYAVWAISLFGAIGTYVMLNSSLVSTIAIFFAYIASIMFFCARIGKVRQSQAPLYSFSRSPKHVIGDIVMKTIEMSFFSLILDIAVKNVTLDQIFASMKLTFTDVAENGSVELLVNPTWQAQMAMILVLVQVLLYIGVMLFIYSPEAGREREADEK